MRRAGGKPLRLASKSVRCRALQDRALDAGFRGQLCFTLPEALWLAGHGARDLLVAYPTTDRTALGALAHGEHAASVTVMVDAVAHLDLIESAAAGGAPVRVAIDVDASWRALGGRLHVGVRRSPVHSAAGAAALARAIVARPGLRLVGLMSYEAQIAGLGDHPPGRPWRGAVLRAVQRASARELAARRAAVVAAVRAVAPLELVNGGGTGSVEATAAEAAVTEVTAGSGLYGPTLFDAYGAFRPRPAALFALPVVRRPSARRATLLGGGYLASGAPGADRLPRPFLPRGLRLDRREGAGEVQTPVAGAVADALAVGDRVWLRHAKAGELCERFAELHLVRGDHVIGTVPTYRGEGRTFL
jgi:D-serine deaminase-like pyridoxal phosphate-dependent protein